jgi:hypothetical protein
MRTIHLLESDRQTKSLRLKKPNNTSFTLNYRLQSSFIAEKISALKILQDNARAKFLSFPPPRFFTKIDTILKIPMYAMLHSAPCVVPALELNLQGSYQDLRMHSPPRKSLMTLWSSQSDDLDKPYRQPTSLSYPFLIGL